MFFSSTSNLRAVDALSTLPIEFVSSVANVLSVVFLDRVRDAITNVIGSSRFIGSVVCAVFYCLILDRVRDAIGGATGLSCSIGSGVCAVFCCLCDDLSLLSFPHEEGRVLYFFVPVNM